MAQELSSVVDRGEEQVEENTQNISETVEVTDNVTPTDTDDTETADVSGVDKDIDKSEKDKVEVDNNQEN